MTDTLLLKETLLKELKYADSPDLRDTDLWSNGRPIPHVETAYFVQGVPVIYFSRIENPAQNANDIWKLYRSVWSQSKVPLLYVITPLEIRVYNGFTEPPKTAEELMQSEEEHSERLLKHLDQLTDVETARQKIEQQLGEYDRVRLDTGAFWRTGDGQKIQREGRADHRLLRAMDYLRRRLLNALPNDEQSKEIAYALIGRSIFIRYLEDREILTPDLVSEITNGLAHNYLSILENHATTYSFFRYLNQRFNGDLFPVNDEERKRIDETHLGYIRQFLSGDDADTNQLALWPYYDFTHIPIQLISGIYDTFLSKETREELGAYYTPLALVDFIIEETLPRNSTNPNTSVLDPTCGSGVFLVRAYQRLVEIWSKQQQGFVSEQRRSKVLSAILKQNIFGVDIQRNAIRIAAFSLYLAMLDYLNKEEILAEDFRFPGLENSNLICVDFILVEDQFARRKFDRVLGNLPWGKSQLKGETLKRANELHYATSGKQIVQPLLQHAPKFCDVRGELALIASAKATIFVTSDTHEDFRWQFFQQYQVRAIANFSALRHELFLDTKSPLIALFYKPLAPTSHDRVVYAVPKPSSLSQKLAAIVLDASEIKYLEREELVYFPALWKIALWGNPRDAAIIKHLQSFPTLHQKATEYDWLVEMQNGKKDIPQGFIVGDRESRKKDDTWLQGKQYVDTKRFRPYLVETHGTVKVSRFERPRRHEIYYGPLVLIRRSTHEAAFLEQEKIVAYKDKITGIPAKPGQEHLLKWLVAYVNSSLVRYYHFLTSTSWGVERGTTIHEEYKRMPFFVPDHDDPRLKEVVEHVDRIIDMYKQHMINIHEIGELQERINNLIYEIYNLSPVECEVIRDTIQHVIPYFSWTESKKRVYSGKKAAPVKPPEQEMILKYAQTFRETATHLLGYQDQTLNAIVFQDGAPLNVVEFELVNQNNVKDVQYIRQSQTLRNRLRELDDLLLERHNPTFYTRRYTRIFDGPRFYIIRPNESHLWTSSQALADADGFTVEILARSKKTAMEASQ